MEKSTHKRKHSMFFVLFFLQGIFLVQCLSSKQANKYSFSFSIGMINIIIYLCFPLATSPTP
jgi:hypothetical protein